MGQLATFAFVFAIISADTSYSQRYEITNKPDNHVVPAHCIYSRDSITSEFVFEFFSEGSHASAFSSERGDTLTITLVPHRRDQESPITFAPGVQAPINCQPGIGIVQVVLCHDTAALETRAGRINLLRQSTQLVFDSAREIPTNVITVQTDWRRSKSSHALIAAALRQFPNALESKILEPGIYPSLQFPVVQVADIGRRQRVNETTCGYLIAFHILDAERSDEISNWLENQKRDL
ncbi:MAG: hypothetical protein WAU88_01330 [Candidatus Zixiibacteriota bacterium]